MDKPNFKMIIACNKLPDIAIPEERYIHDMDKDKFPKPDVTTFKRMIIIPFESKFIKKEEYVEE